MNVLIPNRKHEGTPRKDKTKAGQKPDPSTSCQTSGAHNGINRAPKGLGVPLSSSIYLTRHRSLCLSVIEVWLSSMAAAFLVDAPWSWHFQCPAVSITMSSPSSQLHALASWALLCRVSELPHVAGPQRLVGIFTQASWTPFTTRSLLRPFLVQAVFKKLSGWALLSLRLPCYPV